MGTAVKKICTILLLFFAFCFSLLVSQRGYVYALMINAQDIKEIAIYGQSSDYGWNLHPDKLVFNVTDPSVISSMISSIEFSTERVCSALGSASSAFVYIKFNDNSIEGYDLVDLWSHISKVGMRGSCYYISQQGRTLFESNAQ